MLEKPIQHASRDYALHSDRHYQLRHKNAWQAFTQGQPPLPQTQPDILAAWERCRSRGVDPHQTSVKLLLTPKELHERRKNLRVFLDISRPMMEHLYAFVSDTNFVIALSDHEGWLLDVFGNEVLCNSVERGNLTVGANWSEASAGNNFIGTALFTDQPVLIIGCEHYCRCSQHHAGVGAPIHDDQGRLIGCIAMAGVFEDVHPHTLGMIIAAASAIEMQLSMKRAWLACDTANNHKSAIMNSVSEGILGTDAEGRITFCNDKAARILRLAAPRLMERRLSEVLPPAALEEFRRKINGSLDKETVFQVEGSYVKCICSCEHMLKDGVSDGMVLVFSEYSRAERLAGKLVNKSTFWRFDNLVCHSRVMKETVATAVKIAATDSNVLLLGESGTGKDVFAQAIHNAGRRRDRPYVAINCAALPKELINSELFGYSEGAFTGAKKGGSKGKVELANGGTLFLDEIGEMPLEQQTILLRLLENRSIQKIGESSESEVDVRIIAATNKNLYREVEAGRFREDLYYRLHVFSVLLPPLRERREDIVPLVLAFVERLSKRSGRPAPDLSREVLDYLSTYDWPGNIRELQNVMERASMLSDGFHLTLDNLRASLELNLAARGGEDGPERPLPPPPNKSRSLTAGELTRILEKNNGNITRACRDLGISRPTMYRKLEFMGLRKKLMP